MMTDKIKDLMQSKLLRKFIVALLLAIIAMLLSSIAFRFSDITEAVYSEKLYPIIGQLISLITGIFPFSLAELLVLLVLVLIPVYLLFTFIQLIKGGGIHTFLSFITRVLLGLAVLYFLFITLWALNYQRLPFSTITKMDIRPASISELASLCEKLVDRANTLRNQVHEDSNGIMLLETDKKNALFRAPLGYQEAAKQYPLLGGKYGSPKAVFFSKAMSYMGISGIYFPFTGEANVNMDQTDSMLPCTISHEMAHQRGFAREDEANYIGYLTCSYHPDKDFQYSGTLLALIYTMNALALYDNEKAQAISAKYSSGVTRDLKAINQYWKKFEGPAEKVQNHINNSYLKANRQSDGVYSYGRMVDLLIAEQRQKSADQ